MVIYGLDDYGRMLEALLLHDLMRLANIVSTLVVFFRRAVRYWRSWGQKRKSLCVITFVAFLLCVVCRSIDAIYREPLHRRRVLFGFDSEHWFHGLLVFMCLFVCWWNFSGGWRFGGALGRWINKLVWYCWSWHRFVCGCFAEFVFHVIMILIIYFSD